MVPRVTAATSNGAGFGLRRKSNLCAKIFSTNQALGSCGMIRTNTFSMLASSTCACLSRVVPLTYRNTRYALRNGVRHEIAGEFLLLAISANNGARDACSSPHLQASAWANLTTPSTTSHYLSQPMQPAGKKVQQSSARAGEAFCLLSSRATFCTGWSDENMR